MAGKRARVRALLAAIAANIPNRCEFELAPGQPSESEGDVSTALPAAAAAAIVDCELPAGTRTMLFGKVLGHDDEALVARAIAAWGAQANPQDLERAAKDSRPTVAGAVKAAQARRAGK